jgi:sarcosine oxidase subunit gamma
MSDLTALREPPLIAPSPLLRLLPSACRFLLRGGEDVIAAASSALGLPSSATACRAAVQGDWAVLWLGPDERLLIGPSGRADETIALLGGALTGRSHSLVEVSHRQVALEISGPHAAAALNAGCPLDLDLRAFPVGMCTRTVLAKSEIVLWRTAEQTFRVEVSRSFASYVSQLLATVAREFRD